MPLTSKSRRWISLREPAGIALETLRTQLASHIDELRQEGVKLRTILTGMSEGVALVQDAVFTVANPSFSKLLNLPGVGTVGEINGQRVEVVAVLHGPIKGAGLMAGLVCSERTARRILPEVVN